MLGIYRFKCSRQCPELIWKQLSLFLFSTSISCRKSIIYDTWLLNEIQTWMRIQPQGWPFAVRGSISNLFFLLDTISCVKVVPRLLGQTTAGPISLLECRWKLKGFNVAHIGMYTSLGVWGRIQINSMICLLATATQYSAAGLWLMGCPFLICICWL